MTRRPYAFYKNYKEEGATVGEVFYGKNSSKHKLSLEA
jgi:hypothetical protein